MEQQNQITKKPTFQQAAGIFWFIFWRSSLTMFMIGILIGFILVISTTPQMSMFLGQLISMPLYFLIGTFYTQLAFTEKFNNHMLLLKKD